MKKGRLRCHQGTDPGWVGRNGRECGIVDLSERDKRAVKDHYCREQAPKERAVENSMNT